MSTGSHLKQLSLQLRYELEANLQLPWPNDLSGVALLYTKRNEKLTLKTVHIPETSDVLKRFDTLFIYLFINFIYLF